jgi:rhodanese-related sulfurtransferase
MAASDAAAALPFEMSVDELARERGPAASVLDVREPWELEICRLDGSIDIPLGTLPGRAAMLPRAGKLVVMCHHGRRSAQAVEWLRANGFPNAINLAGGIDAWARRIDPEMRTY